MQTEKEQISKINKAARSVANFARDNFDNFQVAFKSTITVLLFFVAFAMVLYALIVLVRFVLG